MIDFKIPGTKMPVIPAGTEYILKILDSTNFEKTSLSHNDMISLGYFVHDDNSVLILSERNGLTCMLKESDIIRLAKEQGMIKEEFVLPEKWCCKRDTKEKSIILSKWANEDSGSYSHHGWSNNNYIHSHDCELSNIAPRSGPKREFYTEITFEQFLKYVLKKDGMKTKIIAYKAPYDMFDGCVKKGCFYKPLASRNNKYYAAFDINTNKVMLTEYNLPKEIVETWEPVYKPLTPDVTTNGYKGEFFKDYVKFGCAEISKEVFIDLATINEYPNTNRDIESVTIGAGIFSKKQIKEIAEYYMNKDEQV